MTSAKSGSELGQRVIVGAALILLAVGVLWLGGVWFWMLLTAMALLMLYEYAPLVGFGDPHRRHSLLAMCIPLGLMSPLAAGPGFLAFGALAGMALAVLATLRSAPLAVGLFYVGVPAFSLLWLRLDPGLGLVQTLWTLAIVWATDIGAYFAGRAIGGPKIAPAISPSKTWAGLGGGIVAAALTGWAFAQFGGLRPALALLSGPLAIAAQAGDFFESWLKRRAGVKDSGNLLPGHGGILDRLDGVVAVAPLAALAVLALQ